MHRNGHARCFGERGFETRACFGQFVTKESIQTIVRWSVFVHLLPKTVSKIVSNLPIVSKLPCLPYIVTAYIVMAFIVMAYIVMACIVMACTVMAYIAFARAVSSSVVTRLLDSSS